MKKLFKALMKFAEKGTNVSGKILFLAVFFFISFSILSSIFSALFTSEIESKTALVLNLQGQLVEESLTDPKEKFKDQLTDSVRPEVELRAVVRALEEAAGEKKITHAVLLLNDFEGGGLASMREVGAALKKFKAAGKEVFVHGSYFDQRAYYLAAHATEIALDPIGGIVFTGYGRYRQYYREAFERIGIKVHLVQTGKYKNFAETFVSDAPSEATKEVDRILYGDLWGQYLADVEALRSFEKGAITNSIENLVTDLKADEYDFAQYALKNKFVDSLMPIHEFRQLMIAKGEKDEENHTFRQISYHDYLKTLSPVATSGEIAIIVAEGGISDGSAPAGSIGGDSTSSMVRKAREDESVKAIVLRVSSPGGSAFASELIRREFALAQEAGKPVIVSMGDVAASGGYWISMAADEIYADPATITGSIGVVGMMMTAEEVMKKLSVSVHGSSTTWLGEAMPDPRRPLDPRTQEVIKGSIQKTYKDFLTLVAGAREREVEEIQQFAEGRVWTGQQALERGLVDQMGGLESAIQRARELAELDDKATAFYWQREMSQFEKIISSFATSIRLPAVFSDLNFFSKTLQQNSELSWFWLSLKDNLATGPKAYAHCFCEDQLL